MNSKLFLVFLVSTFLLLRFSFSLMIDPLEADKFALLEFAAQVSHVKMLNWRSYTPICYSWVGITCYRDGSRVHALHLPGMGLYGPIPRDTSLAKLDGLMVLSLHSNFLSGSLPAGLFALPSLRYVYLQNNNFSGTIPSFLPPKLRLLNLSSNLLTGNVPSMLSSLTGLVSLGLQNNLLTGSIPEINALRLKFLNLSNNNLSGSIPVTLQKFPWSSFRGNVMLCGPPLKDCAIFSPAPTPSQRHIAPSSSPTHVLSKGSFVAIAIGGSVIAMPLIVLILICYLRRLTGIVDSAMKGKRAREEAPYSTDSRVHEAENNKLMFMEGCSYNFDLEDLFRASAEVLGKGSCGTTYKAVLHDGQTVVIKRLKEVDVAKREFERQMEMVGRIRENVLPLRAYYFSRDEKLLVYDYVRSGSLSLALHGYKETRRAPLNWRSRVKICLEVAKGITRIHSAGGGRYIHGNIKSPNVLLYQNNKACISDFGITSLTSYQNILSRSIRYIAPEAVETRKPTQKSDVYSFGVILLEMLTGKSAAQSEWNDGIDLPRWVQSVVREEWTAEVFDLELLREQNIEEEMIQMLHIGMACVAEVPEMRPSMEQIIRMIDDIQPSNLANGTSSSFIRQQHIK